MTTADLQREFRSVAQQRADEEIAADAERYLVRDAATKWTVMAASDERRSLAEAAADETENNAIASGGLNVPFLWNGKVYRIARASHRSGQTTVESSPRDTAFESEVRRRIEAVPFRVLTFYQGFGFICFPEDYARYQG